jgi:signal transduction histidine kinase
MAAPRDFFRYAGLVACAMVTLPILIDENFVLPAKIPASAIARNAHAQVIIQLAFCAVVLTMSIGFGVAFWWNTRETGRESPSKASIALLVAQFALSLLFTETMYLVAAQLPFMMPIRAARKWLAAMCGLLIVLSVAAVLAGDFVPVDSLTHSPLAISAPGTVLYMLTWILFAFGGGYLAVSETRNYRELARIHAELMATQSLLSDDTRQTERMRISRELHDVVGHHLAGLSINLQLASHLVEGRAAEPVNEAHLVAKLLLAEVREVVGGLRDSRQTDLRRALELLSKGVDAPRIHLELPEDLERIEPATAHIFFRCVQEAITNAIKHANARNLWIKLKKTARGWEMRIGDDGRGAASVQAGNGLKGMEERLKEAGGQMSIESQPGEGFSLRVSIPYAGEPI